MAFLALSPHLSNRLLLFCICSASSPPPLPAPVPLSYRRLLFWFQSSMASSRRPSHTITSCVFHNSKEDGVWKPLIFHVNDWVTMLPSCKGAHRVKRTKRGEVKNHWKGRILAFKVAQQGWLAKVQHVYSPKDMLLDSAQNTSLQSYCK